ncbi:kinase-like protein, partial [Hymenopellis radicata]
FCREALSWRQTSHENILPFYGVSDEMFQTGLCLISPWIDNGTVLDFLGTHPGHDRRGWVWDVSAGLNYLHQLDPCIVHKDIRGGNLLVGEDHRCYIVDFGISIVAETLIPGTNTRGAGTTQWKPLEVLTNSPPSDKSLMPKVDIYSFGCTIVEVLGFLKYGSCHG